MVIQVREPSDEPAVITRVDRLDGTKVGLTFADGFYRQVDLRPLMVGPIFDEIFEQHLFDTITVDSELGTVVWQNGADLDPDVLRHGIASAVPANQLPLRRALEALLSTGKPGDSDVYVHLLKAVMSRLPMRSLSAHPSTERTPWRGLVAAAGASRSPVVLRISPRQSSFITKELVAFEIHGGEGFHDSSKPVLLGSK